MENAAKKCVFCSIQGKRIIAENEHAYAIRDRYPITELHSLIIPKLHFSEYFALDDNAVTGCESLMRTVRSLIIAEDDLVRGFNIAINCGAVAGQAIFHCHINLIPRRDGETLKPRGSERHLIPGMF